MKVLDPPLDAGSRARDAALRVQQIELRVILLVAVREKRDLPAIGGELRKPVHVRPEGEHARIAGGELRQANTGGWCALERVDQRAGEHRPAAMRRGMDLGRVADLSGAGLADGPAKGLDLAIELSRADVSFHHRFSLEWSISLYNERHYVR